MNFHDPLDPLLSQREAAELIGITRQAVSHAVITGLLQHEKAGPYTLIRESVAWAYKTHRPLPGWKKGKPRKNVPLTPSAS